MADVLLQMPGVLLKEFQRSRGSNHKPLAGEDRYFLFPEQLYARACAIDPHPDAFSQWMRWAAGQSVSKAENVAREWHRIRRDDIEPLLYLMEQAEKRNAFPKALSYLEKAERIDAVHSVVRAARLRLLVAGAMRHLQQKKPHLAAEKLALMAALPQSQQGDRPAFLAALRHLICAVSGDKLGRAAARLEVESLLGGGLAAGLLLFGVAAVSKCLDLVDLPCVHELSRQERTAIPASLARAVAVAKDLGIKKFQLPVSYFAEAEAQFPDVSGSLDIEQIRSLGELGMATEHRKLAWSASGAGLERGGSSEARFLLLRARAMPAGYGERYLALAAAAAELGRFHRDIEVVDGAVEIVRNPFGGHSISLTLEQAREVVRKEIASPAFPGLFGPGPDYSDLLAEKLCQCPDCRQRRGETTGLFDEEEDENGYEPDEDDMERIFNESVPADMPPDIARMLLEVMKEALLTGESPDEIMSRIAGGRGGKQKKGRRR
jgi:tetratricopeptide (TPR) repeat protein